MQSLSASHYYPGHWNQARTPTIPESMLQQIKSAQVVLRFLTGPRLHLGGVRKLRIKCLAQGHIVVGPEPTNPWITRPEPIVL